MGDFRFSLKGVFRMGQVEQKFDFWLNYSDQDQTCGMDSTVHDFFVAAFDEGVKDVQRLISGDHPAEERAPCPFCGYEHPVSTPTFIKDTVRDGERWQVRCQDCGSSTGPDFETEADAWAAWERRSEKTSVETGA